MSSVFKVQTAQAPEPIEVGVHPAKLKGWELRQNDKYGDYIRCEFEIHEGEYQGTVRSMNCSTKLTKGKAADTTSKLYKLVSALMNREPEPEEEIDLDKLVGETCRIFVEDRPGDTEGWQDITKVMPPKQ